MITALKPIQQHTHTSKQTPADRHTPTFALNFVRFVYLFGSVQRQTCFSAFLNAAKNRWCLRKDTKYAHTYKCTCICMYVRTSLCIDTYLFVCGLNIIVAIVYNKNVGPAETCNTFYALRLNTSSSLSTSPPRLFSANVLLLVRLQRRRMANDLYHTYKQTRIQRDKHTRAYIRCSRFLYGGLLLLLFSPLPPS